MDTKKRVTITIDGVETVNLYDADSFSVATLLAALPRNLSAALLKYCEEVYGPNSPERNRALVTSFGETVQVKEELRLDGEKTE